MTSRGTTSATITRRVAVAIVMLMFTTPGCWSSESEPTATTAPATTAVPAEIEQAIADYHAAWANHDADAIRAITTDDYVRGGYIYAAGDDLSNPDQVSLTDAHSDDAESIISHGFRWQLELVGGPIIIGDGPWFLSVAERRSHGNVQRVGIATYVIVTEADTLKIANHTWAALQEYNWDNSN